MIGTTAATGEVGGRVTRRLVDRGNSSGSSCETSREAPDLRDAHVFEFGGYSDHEGMLDLAIDDGKIVQLNLIGDPERIGRSDILILDN